MKDNPVVFGYHPSVIERFPAVRAGAVWARGIDNRTPNALLTTAFRAEQTATRIRLASTPLAELPSIAAWRRTFSAFGVSPTKHRNAAEALLRRLTKQGDLPEINPLVDLGNLVSIRAAGLGALLLLRPGQSVMPVRRSNGVPVPDPVALAEGLSLGATAWLRVRQRP
jgi:hypothetical protein